MRFPTDARAGGPASNRWSLEGRDIESDSCPQRQRLLLTFGDGLHGLDFLGGQYRVDIEQNFHRPFYDSHA